MEAYFSLLAVFTTSLLGSLHCVGMCGGFISLYSLNGVVNSAGELPSSGAASGPVLQRIGGHDYLSREISFHGLYNFGRLCAYLTLGIVAGSLGSGVNRLIPSGLRGGLRGEVVDEVGGGVGGFEGLQQGVGILAGLVIVVWGILALLRESPQFTIGTGRLAGVIGRLSALLTKLRPLKLRAINLTSVIRPERGPFALGLLSGILPCGWLYTFVTMAFGAASPLSGLMIMFAFWLGTVPAMLLSGFVMMRITGRLRKYAPTATALLVITLGLFTLSGKFTPHDHHHDSSVTRTGYDCAR